MMQLIGTLVCVAGIAWLFYLDRDDGLRPSPALWIPTLWLLVCASRSVTEWLSMRPAVTLALQYSESSPIDAAFYSILIAAGVLVLNFRSVRVRSFVMQNLPLLLFLAYCALSVLWSDFQVIAFKRLIKSAGDVVMVMIVLTDPRPKNAIETLFRRVAFVLVPLSVLFILCFPDLGSGFTSEDMARMYFGVTTFKNLLGETAMVCGLFSLWAAVRAIEDRAMTGRRRHLLAHSIAAMMAAWLIVKADSITSLACFVLAGSAMILVCRRRIALWRVGPVLIVATAVAIPAIALFLDPLGPMLSTLGRNSTLTGRTLIWRAVLMIHTNPWFGAGFESFWLGDRMERVWHMSVDGIQEAHNGYLELYLNLGWCGLLLIGGLIASGFARAFAELRRDPSQGSLRIAFLTAVLIFSLTEAGFRMLSPIWIAFLLSCSVCEPWKVAQQVKKVPQMLWFETGPPRRVRLLR